LIQRCIELSKFFIISLDPAQIHDFSALAVLEKDTAAHTYKIVSLSRRQHQPYTEIVEWANKVYLNPRFREDVAYPPVFLLDVGGVGVAIRDMLKAAGVRVTGIQLTGGEAENRTGIATYNVSKSIVVGRFLRAWDEGRVLMPAKASFLNLFHNELRAFKGAMSAVGRVRFEAEQGENDDLVMSVAQAVWWGEVPNQPKPHPVMVPLPRPDQLLAGHAPQPKIPKF
jgi:hypothetical protein